MLLASLGARYTPLSWLAVSGSVPSRWSSWEDKSSTERVNAGGIGDASLQLSFDLPELIHPTMIRTRCPETGGNILALRDDDRIVKFPHLVFSGGVAFPMGADDQEVDGKFVSPQYQPGAGVWAWNVGAFLSQGLGPVSIGGGVTYMAFEGVNHAGYERPDALVVSPSATWLAWAERLGKVFLAASFNFPLGAGGQKQRRPGSILRQESEELVESEGSDKRTVTLDLGYVMWVGSLWKKRRKIMLGVLASFPLVEGETDTEPKSGHAVSLFSTFNF